MTNISTPRPPKSYKSKYNRIFLIVFVIWLGIVAFLTYEGFEFWAKFVPMVTGLIVTLLLFHIFTDRMERDRQKNRIKERIYFIFQYLVMLCDVDNALTDGESEKAWRGLWNRQLESLNNEVQIASGIWESPTAISTVSEMLDDERSILGEVIARYYDLSDIALVSLKHLDKHLLKLISRLESRGESQEDFERDISNLIKKIMGEIRELRNSGIDIGF